ncbi:Acyl-CoA synthetase member 2 mitochondrial [Blomia tropicalis]|nr:Acyl-CoA synthetase member 2 mitochondrial [Blomia tropicalis]
MIFNKFSRFFIRNSYRPFVIRTVTNRPLVNPLNYNNEPTVYVEKPFSYSYGRSKYELIYKTLGDILDEQIENDSGKPIVISHHEGIQRTFTQMGEDVNRIMNAMVQDLGLVHGDVIGLWSCNTYDWIAIQLACARLGVILCTINPYYLSSELEYALRRADIKALFMPGSKSIQEQVNKYGKVIGKTLQSEDEAQIEPIQLRHIIAIDGEAYSDDILGNRRDKIQIHSLSKLKQNNSTDIDRSLTKLVQPDDPSMIMFTSGTTGKPKGAYLSQFAMINNSRLSARSFADKTDQLPTVVCPLPFFHAFAATVCCLSMTIRPIQLVIPYLRHNIKQMVEAINEHNCTHLAATPTLIIDMLDHIRKNRIEVPSLQTVMAGGASMPVETVHQFVKAVPSVTNFRIGYGATELGPVSTGSRPWYTFEQRTETIGTPIDFVEIKLINPETKRIVRLGETGEILSRGFNNMIGYWKEPEKTNEAIDHAGWYSTGDLGVMDEEGFVKIIGRTKELIIVGGENVYPREIEELLHTHPSIMDAHVIGVPDPRKGEEVCAWIKLSSPDTKLTEDELKDFCKDKLSYFKIPKYFLFVDSFPTTSVGKAKKYVMREITIKKLGLTETMTMK